MSGANENLLVNGLIEIVVEGLLKVVRRHHAETGEIITDELAKERLLAALNDGDSELAQEFARHGWAPPA